MSKALEYYSISKISYENSRKPNHSNTYPLRLMRNVDAKIDLLIETGSSLFVYEVSLQCFAIVDYFTSCIAEEETDGDYKDEVVVFTKSLIKAIHDIPSTQAWVGCRSSC